MNSLRTSQLFKASPENKRCLSDLSRWRLDNRLQDATLWEPHLENHKDVVVHSLLSFWAAGRIIDALISLHLWNWEGRSGLIWINSWVHRLSSNQHDGAIHVHHSSHLFAEGIFLICRVCPRCWWVAKLNFIQSCKRGHVWNGDGWPVLWGLLYPQFLWPRPNTLSNATAHLIRPSPKLSIGQL